MNNQQAENIGIAVVVIVFLFLVVGQIRDISNEIGVFGILAVVGVIFLIIRWNRKDES